MIRSLKVLPPRVDVTSYYDEDCKDDDSTVIVLKIGEADGNKTCQLTPEMARELAAMLSAAAED